MRLQVNVSDEMADKLSRYAKQMGVSRSALCGVFIGQAVIGLEKAEQVIADLGAKAQAEMDRQKSDEPDTP